MSFIAGRYMSCFYLSQMHLSGILIILFVYQIFSNKIIGKVTFGAVTVFFAFSLLYQLNKHNYVPTLDKLFTTLYDVYYSTFARAVPYFVGGGIGYLYSQGKFIGIKKVSCKKFSVVLVSLTFVLVHNWHRARQNIIGSSLTSQSFLAFGPCTSNQATHGSGYHF